MKYAAWVNLIVLDHHNKQIEHEENKSCDVSLASHMSKILQSEDMGKHWRKLVNSLQKLNKENADVPNQLQVYQLIGAAILMAKKLDKPRLRITRKEKDEQIRDDMKNLRKLQITFEKLGDKLPERVEKDLRNKLDTFDRLGELGRPNNPNTSRDILTYCLVNNLNSLLPQHFTKNGQIRLTHMDAVAAIVYSIYNETPYDAKAATKAYWKIKPAFDVKISAKESIDRWPQF